MATKASLSALSPHALGETGDPSAVPYLIAHMESANGNDRRLAASAIRKLAKKHRKACLQAVPALLALTHDGAPQVRQYALSALAALRPALSPVESAHLQALAAADPKPYNQKAAAQVLKACHLSSLPSSAATSTQQKSPSKQQTDSAAMTQRLGRHYLACVEAEDRRMLLLRQEDLGSRFIAPWHGPETFFTYGAASCELRPQTSRERAFLAKGALDAEGADAGLYGYPLYFTGDGRLSPLFVIPVSIEDLGGHGNEARYVLHRAGPIAVNRYLFRGYTDEELDALQDALDSDEFATAAARLRAALAYLDADAFDVSNHETEPFPKGTGARWVRTPVLLRGTRGPYTRNLRQDLSALARVASVQKAATGTALGALWGDGGPPAAPEDPVELRLLNPSQTRATRRALQAPLTTITGPPGTGKSQVVVSLLASAILRRRPILFASKNNRAVDVVRERLREALGEPFDFTVRVGRKEAMEAMAPELLDRLARLCEGERSGGEAEARAALDKLQAALRTLEERRARSAAAEEARDAVALEVPHAWREQSRERDAVDTVALGPLLDDARAYAGLEPLGLIRWFRRFLFGSAVRQRLVEGLGEALRGAAVREEVVIEATVADSFASLARIIEQVLCYDRWLAARSEARAAEEALMSGLRYAETPEGEEAALKREIASDTVRLCRAVWGGRLHDAADGVRAALHGYQMALSGVGGTGKAFAKSLEDLEKAFRRLARHLPVWITPSLSARNALPLRPGLFDLVVIDEASQCDIASAVPLLYRARRAAVIGDPHQLQHIPGIPEQEESDLLTAPELLPDWSYVRHSLFARATAAEEAMAGKQPEFLNEHYRSHEEIIGFSVRHIYEDPLHVRTDEEALRARLPGVELGVFWHDTPGQVPAGLRSAYNPMEIEAVIGLLQRWVEAGWFREGQVSVGVVTPFRAQKERLQRRVRGATWYEVVAPHLRIGTAHTFQGDERDVIVFSPVVSEGMRPGTKQWVAETRSLLNVSVTRARAALHIVGDRLACASAGGVLTALTQHGTHVHPDVGDAR